MEAPEEATTTATHLHVTFTVTTTTGETTGRTSPRRQSSSWVTNTLQDRRVRPCRGGRKYNHAHGGRTGGIHPADDGFNAQLHFIFRVWEEGANGAEWETAVASPTTPVTRPAGIKSAPKYVHSKRATGESPVVTWPAGIPPAAGMTSAPRRGPRPQSVPTGEQVFMLQETAKGESPTATAG